LKDFQNVKAEIFYIRDTRVLWNERREATMAAAAAVAAATTTK